MQGLISTAERCRSPLVNASESFNSVRQMAHLVLLPSFQRLVLLLHENFLMLTSEILKAA
jgi:hypothetical protein